MKRNERMGKMERRKQNQEITDDNKDNQNGKKRYHDKIMRMKRERGEDEW